MASNKDGNQSGGGGGFFSSLASSISNLSSAMTKSVNGLLGYEGLEVVNPEGGNEDAGAEAQRGRWKQEYIWGRMLPWLRPMDKTKAQYLHPSFVLLTQNSRRHTKLCLVSFLQSLPNKTFRSADTEDRDNYWKMMQKYIGADITSLVTLPVIICEPMTNLQKMAELMEYSYLLKLADECEDPHMRLVHAATWFISVYYALQRTWKPFNPILGETYEFVNHDGITFIAEQVCHHPPIGAAHAENEHFKYDITSKVKSKFLGNSVEVYPLGRSRLTLKKSGVVLDLVPPPTKVHNLIFGRTWIDSPGEMILTNLTTGDKVLLYFQPCGWFGAGRYEVDGYVYNSEEEPKILMTGKWNESMSYQPCDLEGEPLPGSTLKEIWKAAEAPKNDKFQYTYFAHKINSFDTAPKKLLPSDSRLRPDRYALEIGDMSKASSEKSRLEERQRADRRIREAKGDEFKPKWFNLTNEICPTPWGDLEVYEFNGKYHEHRAAIDSSDQVEEVDAKTTEFKPWQYEDSVASA